jgi:hypothetical protein
MRFPELALCDTVPDEKTIWEYRLFSKTKMSGNKF